MKVAYPGQIFWHQEVGGISRYFARLAGCLRRELNVNARIYAPLHNNEYLGNLPAGLAVGARARKLGLSNRVVNAVNRRLCWPMVTLSGPSIIHETVYSNRTEPRGPKRVTTVFDMIHEKISNGLDNGRYSRQKQSSIERADLLICVSESTRRDLLEIYPAVAGKTRVVLLGCDKLVGENRSSKSMPLGRPYILFVGQRGWYKNFESLLTAYFSSSTLNSSFDLIAAGGGPFDSHEAECIARFGFAGRIRQVQANDAELAELYRNAGVFVYPTLYEGFGLPPLEAMTAGCAVICGATSSLPEVCGPAAAYADCSDPEQIRQVAEKVLSDEQYRARLIETGYRQAEKFTWRKCAEETLGLYRELV